MTPAASNIPFRRPPSSNPRPAWLQNLSAAMESLASLKLTIFCLVLMMMLVFAGTLGQVNMGAFAAQKKYFNSFLVYFETNGGFKFPVFPGGLIIGALWMVNLVLAHKFRYSWKKLGLSVTHFGLIVLLLGQFLTQILARESQMPVQVGSTKNYSEAPRHMELAIVHPAPGQADEVVSIPQSVLGRDGKLIQIPSLPFEIRVKKYYSNAALEMVQGDNPSSLATMGIGPRIAVKELPPTLSDDEANNVTAYVEVIEKGQSRGTWLISGMLGAPQSISVDGKDYEFHVRPQRHYYPFSLTLKEFRHDKYAGTDIPKNFSSLVHLKHPEKNEDRDALIYMNHPLRYGGLTFYQASFANNDTVSIFQVVENPFWLTPYIACILVALGLAIQFLSHLIIFAKERSSRA